MTQFGELCYENMHFAPVCSHYLLTCRHRLRRRPCASAAAAGTAGGRCHLVVQAENARVSPDLRQYGSKLPFFITSSHLCYLASLSLLPFVNHLFPVSQVSMAGQILFSVLAVTSQGYIIHLLTPQSCPLPSLISR